MMFKTGQKVKVRYQNRITDGVLGHKEGDLYSVMVPPYGVVMKHELDIYPSDVEQPLKYFLVWNSRTKVWEVCQKTLDIKGSHPIILGVLTEEELSLAIEGIFEHHKKVKVLTDLILPVQGMNQ